MLLPNFHPDAWGRRTATCGACRAHSPAIVHEDAVVAWEDLQRIGWSWYVSPIEPDALGYPICPACTAAPPTLDKALDASLKEYDKRRRRKRK